MEWYVILALVLAIPVMLIPVALIWYINAGGVYLAIKEAREKRAVREKMGKEIATKYETIKKDVVVPVPPYWWYLP